MCLKILADVKDTITLPINYNHLLANVIYRFLSVLGVNILSRPLSQHHSDKK